MGFIGTLIIGLAKVFSLLFSAYTFIIIGSVIVSWVNPDPYNPIVKFLRQATEPVFRVVRHYMPKALFKTGLDFTPILVLVALVFLETIIVSSLMDLGLSLRYGSSPYLP